MNGFSFVYFSSSSAQPKEYTNMGPPQERVAMMDNKTTRKNNAKE